MYPNEMLRVQNAVFVLSCCIHNLSSEILAFVLDNTIESIFDSWVVDLNKDAFDKADSQRRFPCESGNS